MGICRNLGSTYVTYTHNKKHVPKVVTVVYQHVVYYVCTCMYVQFEFAVLFGGIRGILVSCIYSISISLSTSNVPCAKKY